MVAFHYISMDEFARKKGLSKQRISQLVDEGKIHPAPVRAGERANAPLYFRPYAVIKQKKVRTYGR